MKLQRKQSIQRKYRCCNSELTPQMLDNSKPKRQQELCTFCCK